MASVSCCDSNTNFDSTRCLALLSSNSQTRRQTRIDVMQGTLRACEKFGYFLPNGTRVALGNPRSVSAEAKKTTMHTADKPSDRRTEEGIVTKIVVENRDCLEEAIRLKANGYNPAVLNMASSRRPGTVHVRLRLEQRSPGLLCFILGILSNTPTSRPITTINCCQFFAVIFTTRLIYRM